MLLFAEHIAPFCERGLRDSRNHVVDDERDVVVWPIAKFQRHLVCTEKRRNEIDRMLGIESLNGAQLTQFRFDGEAISALRFARRCSAGCHFVQAHACERNELLLRCGSCRANGLQDAAARGCDLGVCRTGESLPQFVPAISGIYDMRVSIDEPRNDCAAARVDADDAVERRHMISKGRLRADEDNLSFVRGDGRVT